MEKVINFSFTVSLKKRLTRVKDKARKQTFSVFGKKNRRAKDEILTFINRNTYTLNLEIMLFEITFAYYVKQFLDHFFPLRLLISRC